MHTKNTSKPLMLCIIVAVGVGLICAHVLQLRRILWRQDMDDGIESGSLYVKDGTLYAAALGGELLAMNAATGDERWKRATAEWPDIAVGSQVYVGTGSVIALNRQTGARLWTFKTKSDSSCVAVDAAGTVYAGADQIYALDGATGRQKWAYSTSDWAASRLTFHNGVLYCVLRQADSNHYALHALDSRTGRRLWVFDKVEVMSGPPACIEDAVIVEANDYCLYALQGSSGKVLWRYITPDLTYGVYTIGQKDCVYCVSDDGRAFKLRMSDGVRVWQTELNVQVAAPPAVYGDRLYIGADIGVLYTLDAQNGNVASRYRFSSLLDRLTPNALLAAVGTTSPVVGPQGTIYIGTAAGKVYALKPE